VFIVSLLLYFDVRVFRMCLARHNGAGFDEVEDGLVLPPEGTRAGEFALVHTGPAKSLQRDYTISCTNIYSTTTIKKGRLSGFRQRSMMLTK